MNARVHFVFSAAATLNLMKNLLKYLMIALVLGFGLAACEPNEGAAEDAGAAVEGAAEDAGTAVEGATEDAGEALDNAADTTEDAASDAVEETEDATDTEN